MTQRTYIELDYHELDQLAAQHLGGDWECVAAGEWINNTSYRFPGVDGDGDEEDRADLALIGAGQWYAFHPSPRQVLKALVRRGVLAAGDYLINVYW